MWSDPPPSSRRPFANVRGAAAANDGDHVAGAFVTHEETAEIEHQEHIANVDRLVRVLTFGIPILLIVAALGALGVLLGDHRSLVVLWAPQVALAAVALALRALLRRRPRVSPLLLRVADLLFFGIGSFVVAAISLDSGGLASEDIHGLLIVLIAQALAQPTSYRRGALRLGLTAAVVPLTFVLASPFLPAIARQLRDPAVLADLTERFGSVLAGAALLVAGGHAFWAARRRIIETRAVGRYVLKKRIGSGGMGEVWRAFHPVLKRDVAVKILRSDRMKPDLIARFEREISALTELSHPNTVRVMDCGATSDGLLYFVMELVEGDTLKDLVAREGPLPPARAIHIVRQAARALGEAHGRGIVHRDVKPDNILVTSMGGERDFVKVLDFGIAKLAVDRHDDLALTHAGVIIGTPSYMSPEQAATRQVDARSDLYALGSVLFFALSGRPPFVGSLSTLLLAHLSEPPPYVSSCSPHFVSPALDAVIHTCLAKSPDLRYLSALDLDAALAAVHDEHPAAHSDRDGFEPEPEPTIEPVGAEARNLPTVRPGHPDAEPASPADCAPPPPQQPRSLPVDRGLVTGVVAIRDRGDVDEMADTVRAHRRTAGRRRVGG